MGKMQIGRKPVSVIGLSLDSSVEMAQEEKEA